MKVYVDLVLIVNFFIDLLLLLSVNYILRRNIKWWRLVFGSLFGNVSLIILFFKIDNLFLLIFKLLISFFIIVISFGFRDIKYTIKNILYFYLVSMLLGGGIEFLSNQFKYSNNGLLFIDNGLGLSYIMIFIVGVFIFIKYIKCFIELKNNYSNYFRCKLYFDNKNIIELNAFLDTGNKLKDPYSNKSIILVDKIKIKDLNVRSPVYVPYNSLNNHGLLTCYSGFKLEIDGKTFDRFLVGISDKNFYIDGIDCILNSIVMEGLK
ncbi:MAG: sigma-E processing peptidase SpoIIGA [Candidatus Coprovivens sp.]